MCGRFALFNIEGFGDLFGVYNPLPQINLSYNIAPGTEICAVCGGVENYVVSAEWGIKRKVKSGSKSLKEYSLINIREDTLKEKGYFQKNKRTGRCLIPANGFYEWKKEGMRKMPFYIQIKENPLFAFAGIYETNSSDNKSFSCGIVTTDANAAISEIHDRMPVIFDKNNALDWINPVSENYLSLLEPYPSEKTECYLVGGRVGNTKTDGPDLIKRLYADKWW